MKRYIVFISFILVFSFSFMACSNENEEEDEGGETVMTAPELDGKSTSDPLEVAKDDSYEVFETGSADLEIIGRYVSDESDENGMVELEKDGYKVTFALVLVHDPVVDEDKIYVMGERENTNSGGENMGIPESVIKVNDEYELRDGFTTGTIIPDAKDTFSTSIFLDDEVPETLEITFKEPSDDDGEEADEQQVEEWKVMEFHKE